MRPGRQRQRLPAIAGDAGLVPFAVEQLLQQSHVELVVLRHQNAQRHRRSGTAGRRISRRISDR